MLDDVPPHRRPAAPFVYAALACLVALLGPGGPVSARAQVTAEGRYEAWQQAVDGHQPGARDGAFARIAPWSQRDLTDLRSRLNSRPIVDREGRNRLLKRAALLHADIAMLSRTATGYDLPTDNSRTLLAADGSLVGPAGRTYHWTFARHLLDLTSSAGQDAFVRLWYRATAAYLHTSLDFAELEPHLTRGRELFPVDSHLLLYAGCLQETMAEPRVQNFLLALRTRRDVPGLRSGVVPIERPAARLRLDAERRFGDALRADSGLVEARIRLGHLLGLRGEHQAAAAELRRALVSPLPPMFEYYAWLLLGRAEHAQGRSAEARRAWGRAAELFPAAQSPQLGLSLLAREQEGPGEAIAALALLSNPSEVDPDADPWWRYLRSHLPGMGTLVDEMRRAAR